MNQRTTSICPAVFAIAMTVCVTLSAQAQTEFRTDWGDPDLRGIWSNATLTQLERSDALGEKTHFTEEEAEAMKGTGLDAFTGGGLGTESIVTGELSETWLEPGTEGVRSRRTSLIVDPPNGKVPYTAEGRTRNFQALGKRMAGSTAASYEDLYLGDRCLNNGIIYWSNPFYASLHQIIQSRDHVVILSEWGPHRRLIPISDKAPLDESIALWDGSSRGHWEGNTLVVETGNFNGQNDLTLRGGSADTHFVERFERFDENTIDYSLTITDPASFTQPWTIENTMRTTEGPMLEFACHEGNYALVNILSGARAADKAALEED
jgi:hypothetical protein